MLALESLNLQRLPKVNDATLRAWDRADELAVNYVLNNDDVQLSQQRILVVNDAFGAISCGVLSVLETASLTVWSDSYSSEQALSNNCQVNGLPPPNFVDALATPQNPFDTVIMCIPKSHSLLVDQVTRLMTQLTEHTQVIIPVMVKHLDASLYQQLTKLLGDLTASKAVKKARLFFAHVSAVHSNMGEKPILPVEQIASDKAPINETPINKLFSTPPIVNTWQYKQFNISHYSGVYGRKQLDKGTAFLLSQWPQGQYQNILDIGCGNGILSLQAARTWPDAKIYGVDESYMAVASARVNSEQNTVAAQCCFTLGHDLSEFANQSMDLVLCNPPFHQQRTLVDHIALGMFAEAARVLKTDGELWVVGNRHLGYHVKLKRWFRSVIPQGKHARFVVLACKK